jgi:hypothetical protein
MATNDFSEIIEQSKTKNSTLVDVTGWGKAFGKEWNRFARLTQARQLFKALSSNSMPTKMAVEKLGRGRHARTLVHPSIAVAYAEWLNPEFSLLVKNTFLRVVEGDSDLAAEMLIRDHNKARVERAKKRIHVVQTNKETAELSKEWHAPYAQVHNDRYRGLYEMTAKELRADGGLAKDETPLDAMSDLDLTLNSLANQLAKKAGNPHAMTRVASAVRRLHEETTGEELKPTWEPNRLRPNQARRIAWSPDYQTELPFS